jgi:hypothetical protein
MTPTDAVKLLKKLTSPATITALLTPMFYAAFFPHWLSLTYTNLDRGLQESRTPDVSSSPRQILTNQESLIAFDCRPEDLLTASRRRDTHGDMGHRRSGCDHHGRLNTNAKDTWENREGKKSTSQNGKNRHL